MNNTKPGHRKLWQALADHVFPRMPQLMELDTTERPLIG